MDEVVYPLYIARVFTLADTREILHFRPIIWTGILKKIYIYFIPAMQCGIYPIL